MRLFLEPGKDRLIKALDGIIHCIPLVSTYFAIQTYQEITQARANANSAELQDDSESEGGYLLNQFDSVAPQSEAVSSSSKLQLDSVELTEAPELGQQTPLEVEESQIGLGDQTSESHEQQITVDSAQTPLRSQETTTRIGKGSPGKRLFDFLAASSMAVRVTFPDNESTSSTDQAPVKRAKSAMLKLNGHRLTNSQATTTPEVRSPNTERFVRQLANPGSALVALNLPFS